MVESFLGKLNRKYLQNLWFIERFSSLMNSDSHMDLVSRILGTLLEPPGMCTTVKCWANAQSMYSGRKDEIPLPLEMR